MEVQCDLEFSSYQCEHDDVCPAWTPRSRAFRDRLFISIIGSSTATGAVLTPALGSTTVRGFSLGRVFMIHSHLPSGRCVTWLPNSSSSFLRSETDTYGKVRDLQAVVFDPDARYMPIPVLPEGFLGPQLPGPTYSPPPPPLDRQPSRVCGKQRTDRHGCKSAPSKTSLTGLLGDSGQHCTRSTIAPLCE